MLQVKRVANFTKDLANTGAALREKINNPDTTKKNKLNKTSHKKKWGCPCDPRPCLRENARWFTCEMLPLFVLSFIWMGGCIFFNHNEIKDSLSRKFDDEEFGSALSRVIQWAVSGPILLFGGHRVLSMQKEKESDTAEETELPAPRDEKMNNAKRLRESQNELALKLKERGNAEFAAGQHPDALVTYSKAVRVLGSLTMAEFKSLTELKTSYDSSQQARGTIRRDILVNMATCCRRLQEAGVHTDVDLIEMGLSCCNAAIAIQPNDFKAHFKRAEALQTKGKIAEAEVAANTCLSFKPSSKAVKKLLKALQQSLSEKAGDDDDDVPPELEDEEADQEAEPAAAPALKSQPKGQPNPAPKSSGRNSHLMRTASQWDSFDFDEALHQAAEDESVLQMSDDDRKKMRIMRIMKDPELSNAEKMRAAGKVVNVKVKPSAVKSTSDYAAKRKIIDQLKDPRRSVAEKQHIVEQLKKTQPQLFGADGKVNVSKEKAMLKGKANLGALLKMQEELMKKKAGKDK